MTDSGASAPDVSLVLPVHNQADHIESTLRGYLDTFSRCTLGVELLIVVNGASDRSAEICGQIARATPSVRVIEIAEPGWGRAVRTGLAAARGRILGYTNTARTPAHALVSMVLLAAANPGYVVKAQRLARPALARRVGSVLYNFQCRALFGLPTWDINGTPKVFPRSMPALLELREAGDLIDLEFLLACQQNGYSILEVPVVASGRRGGVSTTGLATAWKLYTGAMRMRHGHSDPPPRASSGPGAP